MPRFAEERHSGRGPSVWRPNVLGACLGMSRNVVAGPRLCPRGRRLRGACSGALRGIFVCVY